MSERLLSGMPTNTDLSAARAAKEHMAAHLNGRRGVRGVGIGRDADGAYTVEVLLTSRGAGRGLPDLWQGVRVHTHVVGRLRAS